MTNTPAAGRINPSRTTDFAIDSADIGRANRATDPIHSLIYFAPETAEALVAAGLRPGGMLYFASRAAAMGAVSARVVAATFYNFNPSLIDRYFPRAWTLVSPDKILDARLAAVDTVLRRLLDDSIATSDDTVELLGLLRTATEGCRIEGRPLYAGYSGLAWPEEPHLALWHATTLLREHRGDGHILALLNAGLSGIEALITHTATGRGFRVAAAKKMRGWSDDEWSAAQGRLRARGLLDEAGSLTDAGLSLRADIEAHTDRLARDPWEHLGADGTARVIELGRPLVAKVRENGAFPTEIFSPGPAR